jgi:hypothetical protein
MAEAHDKERMLAFLAAHWRADHIFVLAPQVFDWQYQKPDGGYHIALALNEDDSVLGFLGYIPTGQFDPDLGCDDIMLAVWKVREDMALPGVGLRLLKLIEKTHKPRIIGAIGISDMVEPIYKAFKYTLGQLHHAALFADTANAGKIAMNVPNFTPVPTTKDSAMLGPVLDTQSDAVTRLAQGAGLAKSWTYLQNRYVNHPYYDYSLRGVFNGDDLQSVIVWRKVEVNDMAILRIVDVIGPPEGLTQVSGALRDEVRDAGADYIDILQTGLDVDGLRAAGFISPADHTDLILPNFFAPFVASNVTIKLAYRDFETPGRALTLFRADSDQDRPNLLSELD